MISSMHLNGPRRIQALLWSAVLLLSALSGCEGGEEPSAPAIPSPKNIASEASPETRCDHASFSGPVLSVSSGTDRLDVYDTYGIGHTSESMHRLEELLRWHKTSVGQSDVTLMWEGAPEPSVQASVRRLAEPLGYTEFLHCPVFRHDAAAPPPDLRPLDLARHHGYGGAPASVAACGELPIPTMQVEVRSAPHRVHDDVLAEVEESRAELLLCYDRKSVMAPDWPSQATASLTLDVQPSGAVSRVRLVSDIDHFSTTRCFGNAAKRWNFRATESDALVVVGLSFTRTRGRRPALCARYSNPP